VCGFLRVCGFPDASSNMLLCDGCNLGWHMYCLQLPLMAVPEGDWLCEQCRVEGGEAGVPTGRAVDPGVRPHGQAADPTTGTRIERAGEGPDSVTPGGPRAEDNSFGGRVVLRQQRDTAGLRTARRGVAHYLGP
jgi:hypothetical protein